MTVSDFQGNDSRPQSQFSRPQLALTYSVLVAVWATGVSWLILHYFLRVQGEFGATPHPMEKWTLALHGAGAFAALWLAGVLWAMHIRPAWKSGFRSPSGISVILVLSVLIVTGYLLYYVGDEDSRARVMLAHWAIGLVSPAPLIVHVVRRRLRSLPRDERPLR